MRAAGKLLGLYLLLWGQVSFAGTQACFDIFQGTAGDGSELVRRGVHQAYELGDCRGIAASEPASVAAELTADLTLDFGVIDSLSRSALHIIYIPTSTLPSGTLLTLSLQGATFDGNYNQLYLTRVSLGSDGALGGSGSAGDTYTTVASSDGELDGHSDITLLVRGGVTISAGDKLVLTGRNAVSHIDELEPISINLKRLGCLDVGYHETVSLSASSAITDGGQGYHIAGGKSDSHALVQLSPQFIPFAYEPPPTHALVNVSTTSSGGEEILARSQFLYDPLDKTRVNEAQAIYPAWFINKASQLDRYMTLTPDDSFNLVFAVDQAEVANTMIMRAADKQSALDKSLSAYLPELASSLSTHSLPELTQGLPATSLFLNASKEISPDGSIAGCHNQVFFALQSAVEEDLPFGYRVSGHYQLQFANSDYRSHCRSSTLSHGVEADGTWLKVPYALISSGSFIRITNDHHLAADVTVDLFGESIDGELTGHFVSAMALGRIPARSSTVYFVEDVAALARSQGFEFHGYEDNEFGVHAAASFKRISVNFFVTAPPEAVLGVSVQRRPGEPDRVIPVLSYR